MSSPSYGASRSIHESDNDPDAADRRDALRRDRWGRIVDANTKVLNDDLLKETKVPLLPTYDTSIKKHREGAEALMIEGEYVEKDKNVFFITIPWVTDRLVRDGLATKLDFFGRANDEEFQMLKRSSFVHVSTPDSDWMHARKGYPKRVAEDIVVRDEEGVFHSFVVNDAFLRYVNSCLLRILFGVSSDDPRIIKNKIWAEHHGTTAWYDKGPNLHFHVALFLAPAFMIHRDRIRRRVSVF